MKKIIVLSSVTALFVALSAYSFFTFVHNKDLARIHKSIRAFEKNNLLSGVVLVEKNHKVIYTKPFGLSDKNSLTANTNASLFLLGSITKTYTATAILLLAQKGIIDLDKAVSNYLPSNHPVWQGSMPDSMNTITIHNLLTHSSGLADYEKITGHEQWYKKIHSPEQVIQFFAREPLTFKPGSKYDYQGSNYLLLGLIIEAVSGKSYAEFLKEHIFGPLDLAHTFESTNAFVSDIQKILPALAHGYVLDPNTKALRPAGMVNMSVDYAESAIIATAHDLFSFITNLFSHKIINAEMLQKMKTPYFATPYGTQVGYGIYLDKSLGYPVFTHAGRIEGFETIFMYEPEQKITVIMVTNIMGSAIYPLAYELMDRVHAA